MGPVARDVVLVAAGMLAGVLGTAGGITTLVSYPALVWVGLPPLPASIANTVAIVACWPGSALTSRRELAGAMPVLRRSTPLAVAGAVVGAILLTLTPAHRFGLIVAPLVLLGSAVLMLEPRLTRGSRARPRLVHLLVPGVFLFGLYNSYFGGGSGILLLGLLVMTVEPDLLRANAAKNMLIGVAAVVGAATFAATAAVRWADVAPLAAGLFLGSLAGPPLARQLPTRILRGAVALTGLALAVDLLVAR